MRGQVRVSFVGTEAFNRRLGELSALGEKATAKGLRALGEKIASDSRKETPVDTGNLRASHYVESAEGVRGPIVEIGVGGPSEPYAIPQHEDLALHHPVGGPKFLERAFDSNVNTEGLALVARVARGELGT